MPRVLRTIFSAILLNSSRFSRHIFAASTFAPLSSFGSKICSKISTSLNIFQFVHYQLTCLQLTIIFSLHFVLATIVLHLIRNPLDRHLVHAESKYKHAHQNKLKHQICLTILLISTDLSYYLDETFHK